MSDQPETGPDLMKRLLRDIHGITDMEPEKPRPWRKWQGQPSVVEAIDEIFDGQRQGPRNPGEEG